MVGVGSDKSRGVFDNIAVQVLPPQVTFDRTDDLTKGPGMVTGPGRHLDRDTRRPDRHGARSRPGRRARHAGRRSGAWPARPGSS